MDILFEVVVHPFGKGFLTLDGAQYSPEIAGIDNAYTAIETVEVYLPLGQLVEVEFGLTGAIKSSDTLEDVNWKWQVSDNGVDWQDLIAEQVRVASAVAYADVTCSGRFAPTGNFLGKSPKFYVRMVVKSATTGGETAAGKSKNSSYIRLVYRI